MRYKLKSIKHSGALAERGTDRTDGRYPERIGRTCYFVFEPVVDQNLLIYWLTDKDGNEYLGYLRTGTVCGIVKYDGLTFVETINSIWEFEDGAIS